VWLTIHGGRPLGAAPLSAPDRIVPLLEGRLNLALDVQLYDGIGTGRVGADQAARSPQVRGCGHSSIDDAVVGSAATEQIMAKTNSARNWVCVWYKLNP
jgi:hypothetical protein